MADDIKYAPCILCAGVNAHKVLARQDRGSEEGSDMYYFLACAGCGAVSMANIYNYGGDDEARYYPSPISRKPPDWLWKLRFLFGNSETPLGELLYEIYEAVQGKQHRLALMGIRAFFEQLKPRLSGGLRPGITTSVDDTCRRALVQALGGHALCGSIA